MLLMLGGLYWVGWCETTHNLVDKVGVSQINETAWGRIIGYLYTGAIIYISISGLASINPLLSIGGIFLLFWGVESLHKMDQYHGNSSEQRASPNADDEQQPLEWFARRLQRGAANSFRIVSITPVEFIAKLLLPGVVLYVVSNCIKGCWIGFAELTDRGQSFGAALLILVGIILTVFLLAGFVFFLLDIQRSYLLNACVHNAGLRSNEGLPVEKHFWKKLSIEIDEETRRVVNDVIDKHLVAWPRRINQWTFRLLVIGLACWSILLVVNYGILSRDTFYLALEGVVTFANFLLQVLVQLLIKMAFLILVVLALLLLPVFLIGISRGSEFMQTLRNQIQSGSRTLMRFFQDLQIGADVKSISAVLSVIGLIALQSYARIQESATALKEQQRLQREQDSVRRKEERDHSRAIDALEQEYKKKIQEYVSGGVASFTNLGLRAQIVARTRDLSEKLVDLDGQPDGKGRGRLLRYLYEAGLLNLPSDSGEDVSSPSLRTTCNTDNLKNRIDGLAKDGDIRRSMPVHMEMERELKDLQEPQPNFPTKERPCLPRVFLDRMDFSYSDLSSATLKNAFLPFIILRNANLSSADLRGVDLRGADLEGANLRNADIRGAKFDHAILNNADFQFARYSEEKKGVETTLITANEAISFQSSFALPDIGAHQFEANGFRQALRRTTRAWDIENRPMKKNDESLLRSRLTFCPFDPPLLQPSSSVDKGRQHELPPHSDIKEISSSSNEGAVERANHKFMQGGSACINRDIDGTLRPFPDIVRYQHFNWSGSNFEGTTLKGMQLVDIDLSGANLRNSTFQDVVLDKVQFVGADLAGVAFEDVLLRDVDFTGADMKDVTFNRVISEGITFKGVEYKLSKPLTSYGNTILRRSGITAEQLQSHNELTPHQFVQALLYPILLPPIPLRPVRLFYWFIPYYPELLFAPSPT